MYSSSIYKKKKLRAIKGICVHYVHQLFPFPDDSVAESFPNYFYLYQNQCHSVVWITAASWFVCQPCVSSLPFLLCRPYPVSNHPCLIIICSLLSHYQVQLLTSDLRWIDSNQCHSDFRKKNVFDLKYSHFFSVFTPVHLQLPNLRPCLHLTFDIFIIINYFLYLSSV